MNAGIESRGGVVFPVREEIADCRKAQLIAMEADHLQSVQVDSQVAQFDPLARAVEPEQAGHAPADRVDLLRGLDQNLDRRSIALDQQITAQREIETGPGRRPHSIGSSALERDWKSQRLRVEDEVVERAGIVGRAVADGAIIFRMEEIGHW